MGGFAHIPRKSIRDYLRPAQFGAGGLAIMGVDLAEAVLVMAVFLGAIVQGFSGFAFSAVAGAILLQVQAPGVAIPLLMVCSLLIQGYVLMRMRAAVSLTGSIPFLAGGAGGVALAALIFDHIDPHAFR